jgi:hypothetical protein
MTDKETFFKHKEDRIVYVRSVDAQDLPDNIRAQIPKDTMLYAVHNSNGERLAIVEKRDMAFVLARQNDLSPVMVH